MSEASSSTIIRCACTARSLLLATSMAAAGGWCQHALALYFHHAGAAIAVRPHAGLIAKARDGNAGAVGGLNDRLVRQRGNFFAVELEDDAFLLFLREGMRQRCIHGASLFPRGRATLIRAPAENT